MSKTTIASDKLGALGVGIAEEAANIKERIVDTFEEGVNTAKDAARRVSRRSQDVTEELLDQTSRRVKKYPFQSVGATFGFGLTIGLILGWLAGHKGK